ncbi:PLP-dependent transferase [Amniculicola lignicola CBS 123094]|uniref:PLP-dependent transferase n=1 Tax=Amniculicola lignicola CBS 123094 TaxID=1392246 RepID=A0A6A5W3E7_9PLEO|nr:PLP-dependent transferase [Amniculicola lignicola CBS 123094]
MAPAAIPDETSEESSHPPSNEAPNLIFHPTAGYKLPRLVGSDGIHLFCKDGRDIVDACGGPGVACLGQGSEVKKRIKAAEDRQRNEVAYSSAHFFTTTGAGDLEECLIESTDGKMTGAWFCSSGSESLEAGIKLARQFHVRTGHPLRVNFIARKNSYHGSTLGALSLGSHEWRREIYEPMLGQNFSHVSRCNAYRDLGPGETIPQYVARLKQELVDEIERLGRETVCAFVVEPVVGAAMGSVPPVPGYFRAMREVCDEYGVLLVFDEVMCGMGRIGYLHAWQHPLIDVVPDVQTFGKGLGAGYQPVAGIMFGKKIADVLGPFAHGQTYQHHPIACAVAYEVQCMIREWNLLHKVNVMGKRLIRGLHTELDKHPKVGDIRGLGQFISLEFVKDKKTKEPFPHRFQVAERIHRLGMQRSHCICLYHGQGCADGKNGDIVMVMPAYTVTEDEIDMIVDRTAIVIREFFETAADL